MNGEAGYAKPREVTQLSLTSSVPLALLAGGARFQIATFLTPAIGWGHSAFQGGSDSGARPMLGGGVMLKSIAAGIAVNIGFQKVFIDRGNTVVGVGVVIGR